MEYIDKVKNLVLTIWELRCDKFDLVEAGLIFFIFHEFLPILYRGNNSRSDPIRHHTVRENWWGERKAKQKTTTVNARN